MDAVRTRDRLIGNFERAPVRLDPAVKVILLHSGTALMADSPQQLGEYTAKQLCRRGIRVMIAIASSRSLVQCR